MTAPYTQFDPTKPNSSTGSSATSFGQETRNQLLAMRDAVLMGTLPDWNLVVAYNADGEPATLNYSKGAERLLVQCFWNGNGDITTLVYSYSSDSAAQYVVIKTEWMTYDVNGNLTSVTWS